MVLRQGFLLKVLQLVAKMLQFCTIARGEIKGAKKKPQKKKKPLLERL